MSYEKGTVTMKRRILGMLIFLIGIVGLFYFGAWLHLCIPIINIIVGLRDGLSSGYLAMQAARLFIGFTVIEIISVLLVVCGVEIYKSSH